MPKNKCDYLKVFLANASFICIVLTIEAINAENHTKERTHMNTAESVKSYKLTHLLYESNGGKYRTTSSNNLEAIDTELFMRCFQSVEDILCS